MLIIILSIIGLTISIYAYFIENKIKENVDYKPFCDISDKLSCSKPVLSKYSNLFYFSNSIMGIFYYIAIIALAWLNQVNILFYLSCACLLISLILAYILFSKIKVVCLICLSIYIINLLIFILALKIYL